MTQKPHISMVRSGSGAWGVYPPPPRRQQRIIGKNNTFRTFGEASVYAKHVYHLVSGGYKAQLMFPITNRRA